MNARERAKYKWVQIEITNAVEGDPAGLMDRVLPLIPEEMLHARISTEVKSNWDSNYAHVVLEGYIPKTKEDKEKEKLEKIESEKRSLEHLERLAAAHGKKLV